MGERPDGSNGKSEPGARPHFHERDKAIWRSGLSAQQKLLLLALDFYAGDFREANPSQRQLALDLSTTDRAVRRTLASLKSIGVLDIVHGRRSATYPINWPALQARTQTSGLEAPSPDSGVRPCDAKPGRFEHSSPDVSSASPDVSSIQARTPASDNPLRYQQESISRDPREARTSCATDAGPPTTNGTAETKRRSRKPKAGGPESVLIPAVLATPAFLAAWESWLADRRERRRPMTARGAAMALRKLADVGPERAVETIEASISNGWQGLFPERAANSNGRRPPDPLSGVREWAARHADDETPVVLFEAGDRRC